MDLTIKPATATLDVVTDMEALRRAIDLTRRLEETKTPAPGTTEAEASTLRAEHDRMTDELKAAADAVTRSTLTLTLRGLPSNQWGQIVLRCTRKDGTRDLNKLAQLALPAMATHAARADGTPVEASAQDLAAMAETLTDSQTMDALTLIQSLNTPPTGLPKAALTLISSTT